MKDIYNINKDNKSFFIESFVELNDLIIEQLLNYLRKNLDNYTQIHSIYLKIQKNGVILGILPEKFSIIVLGCLDCFNENVHQNNLGHPLINNKKLINIKDLKQYNLQIGQIPETIKNNIWCCSNCGKVINKLLPQFI